MQLTDLVTALVGGISGLPGGGHPSPALMQANPAGNCDHGDEGLAVGEGCFGEGAGLNTAALSLANCRKVVGVRPKSLCTVVSTIA